MPDCMRHWELLVQTKEPQTERRHAEDFARCVHERQLVYELALSDRASGKPIPVGEIATTKVALTVRLMLEDRNESMTWQPVATESVYPLLRE